MIETYDSADDLKQFGVHYLTAEACNINMRILCDLTHAGVDLVQDFYHMEVKWDSRCTGHPDDPCINSVMLPRSAFEELWLFAHVRQGTPYVFQGGHVHSNQWTETVYEEINETLEHPDSTWKAQSFAADISGMTQLQPHIDQKFFYIAKYITKLKCPAVGLDNIHNMSGRSR